MLHEAYNYALYVLPLSFHFKIDILKCFPCVFNVINTKYVYSNNNTIYVLLKLIIYVL